MGKSYITIDGQKMWDILTPKFFSDYKVVSASKEVWFAVLPVHNKIFYIEAEHEMKSVIIHLKNGEFIEYVKT